MIKLVERNKIFYFEDYMEQKIIDNVYPHKLVELASVVIKNEKLIKCRLPLEYIFDKLYAGE